MATTYPLDAEVRQRSGSSDIKRMRNEGLVPAVIYGASQENINLKVGARALRDIMGKSASDNILIDLSVEGESAAKLALVQDIQYNPITGGILHVDFHAVQADEKIHAHVPVELTGDPKGVTAGGLLEQLIYSLQVHCAAQDLPELLTVEVSALDVGDSACVRDIEWPEGVEAVVDDEVVVALVSQTRTAKSEEAAGGEGEGAEGEGEGAEGEGDGEGGSE